MSQISPEQLKQVREQLEVFRAKFNQDCEETGLTQEEMKDFLLFSATVIVQDHARLLAPLQIMMAEQEVPNEP